MKRKGTVLLLIVAVIVAGGCLVWLFVPHGKPHKAVYTRPVNVGQAITTVFGGIGSAKMGSSSSEWDKHADETEEQYQVRRHQIEQKYQAKDDKARADWKSLETELADPSEALADYMDRYVELGVHFVKSEASYRWFKTDDGTNVRLFGLGADESTPANPSKSVKLRGHVKEIRVKAREVDLDDALVISD